MINLAGFRTVVGMALRYRWSLGVSLCCSVMVGVLWGANIGTLYPFMSVILNGKSLNDLLNQELQTAAERCEELRGKLAAADAQPPNGLDRQSLQAELEVSERSAGIYKRLQPYAQAYLPHDAFSTLALIVSVLLVGTALKGVFLVGSEVLVSRAIQRTAFDLRLEFYRRTLRLDLKTFEDDRRSKLLSYFTHHLNHVENGLGNLFGQSVREPLKMLACIVGAAFISWRLLIAAMLIAPVGVLMIRYIWRQARRHDADAMNLMSELYSRLAESFAGIRVVKAFNMQWRERIRLYEVSKSILLRFHRLSLARALVKPLTELASMAGVFFAILLGSYLVLRQETHVLGVRLSASPPSISALLVFYGLLLGIGDPLRKMSSSIIQLQRGAEAANRVVDCMNREASILDPVDPQPVPKEIDEIAFRNVCFSYRPGRQVLKHVSLKIGGNETVVLVGANGCGKSTLINLLMRFYDPNRGTVQLAGVDIRELKLRDLRDRIALVPQDAPLFDDSIMNNIRYGAPLASDAEVMAAAKLAQADFFITNELPDGYDTVVGERGEFLSGGQRQRIALARAVLRNPDILILDEATSEIDVKGERRLFQSLGPFFKNRIVILISHRQSALHLADRVVVMSNGRITDVGNHQDLLKRSHFYRVLCRSSNNQRRSA